MINSWLLKGAIAALTFIEVVDAIQTSGSDINAFPEFDLAMQSGGGFQWKSYGVQTIDGYNVTLFNLIGDQSGVKLESPAGPVLLMHGMFSGTLDWLSTPQIELPSTAVQLAQEGYDVWIASARGRPFSRTHATLSADDPLTAAEYWAYSYEEIGMYDLPAFIDTIIQERKGKCDKVTIVAHSTAVNSALVLASKEPAISNKVAGILGVGPCLNVNVDDWFFAERDISSVQAIYNFMAQLGITNLFGVDHAERVDVVCSNPAYAGIC